MFMDSNKYEQVINDMLNNGLNLNQVCLKYSLPRRTIQYQISKTKFGKFMKIRYYYIGEQLKKGYTMKEIRRSLNYSTRTDLNNLMWQKVRGDLTPGLRWKLLKSNNFRCKLCGADATDRKLHIDHILPVSKGGKTVISNLRVLCSACNLGRRQDLKINTFK